MAAFNRRIAIAVGITQYQSGVKPLRTAVSEVRGHSSFSMEHLEGWLEQA